MCASVCFRVLLCASVCFCVLLCASVCFCELLRASVIFCAKPCKKTRNCHENQDFMQMGKFENQMGKRLSEVRGGGAGRCGKVREVAGSCGKVREGAGMCGKPA